MWFALVFMAVAWAEMAMNPETGGSVHHTVLLWPLPHMIVAVAFGQMAQKFGRAGKAALVLMLALALPANVLVINEYYRLLNRNGAGLTWSDALFPMSDFLKTAPANRLVLVDWGYFDTLRLLHAGKLPLRNGADPLSKSALDSTDREVVHQWLAAQGTLFVGHTDDNELFRGSNARLADVARQYGMEKEFLSIIPDRNGRPIFEIYRYNARPRGETNR
jgi:hypothetical protein